MSPGRRAAGAVVLLLGGCHNDDALIRVYSCPFSEAAETEADLGFTAEEVLRAASVSSSGTTEPEEGSGAFSPFSLDHAFAAAGEASVVAFDGSGWGDCPVGLALRVPATYSLTGALADGWVSVEDHDFALIATAAELDAISTDWSETDGRRGSFHSEVSPELEAQARDAGVGVTDFSACELTFSVGPRPKQLTAGAWSQEVRSGGLTASCGGAAWSVFHWTGAEVDTDL